MCRIFGFRSVILSQVHKSLISADNALMSQSSNHPDGWGVAYYIDKTPHVIKSTQSAIKDQLFKKISGIVSSQTVIAHIRKATQGELSILNSHPFQYGRWVFAHNGNIKNFEHIKNKLEDLIEPKLKRFFLGETDSEIIFLIILTFIEKHIQKNQLESCFNFVIKNAVKDAIQAIVQTIGPLNTHEKALPSENFLTFLLTNGELMYALQGGQPLHYSSHKVKCSEREACPSFSASCEQPVSQGQVNHMIFSSEPLHGENVWMKMAPGDFIGVDSDMYFSKEKINLPFL